MSRVISHKYMNCMYVEYKLASVLHQCVACTSPEALAGPQLQRPWLSGVRESLARGATTSSLSLRRAPALPVAEQIRPAITCVGDSCGRNCVDRPRLSLGALFALWRQLLLRGKRCLSPSPAGTGQTSHAAHRRVGRTQAGLTC